MNEINRLRALLHAEAKEHARLKEALEAIERRNPAHTVLEDWEDPTECAECGNVMQLREDADKTVSHICDPCAQEIAEDVGRIAFAALHLPDHPTTEGVPA